MSSQPKLLNQVRDVIRLRHYFCETEKVIFIGWINRFISFYQIKPPRDIGVAEVEAFLTHSPLQYVLTPLTLPIPNAIGKRWIEQQQLLLLLDGLDEVPLEGCDRCDQSISSGLWPRMGDCYRIPGYKALGERLGFQSTVSVRSLNDPQNWQYLNQAKTSLTRAKYRWP